MLASRLLALIALSVGSAQVIPSYFAGRAESPFGEIARAAGWPDLRDGAGDGVLREIRVTDSYGMFGGVRHPLLRLIETGTGFRAELLLWWKADRGGPFPRSGPGIRCTAPDDVRPVCVTVLEPPLQPDWYALAQRLLTLDECRTPLVVDGGEFLVQLYDQGSLRMYSCHLPSSDHAPADVKEIYQFLHDLEKAVPKLP